MAAQSLSEGELVRNHVQSLSDLVPVGVRLYLSHVAAGKSLRALGKDHGCHASTVLRQVRHLENRRDDPLVDDALRRLDHALRDMPDRLPEKDSTAMSPHSRDDDAPHDHAQLEQDAMLNLRHLTLEGALLIVATDLPKAVITCEDNDGIAQRISVMNRCVAEVMALNDWITCRKQGRVVSYVINPSGRLALRRYCDRNGLAFEPAVTPENQPARRVRYGGVESPVTVLARRRDKNGRPFLEQDLVQVAERLREDFVLAQLDGLTLQDAQGLMDVLERRKVPGPNIAPSGTKAARQRILDVLRDLGPGLGDMALRCCCRLEGVEAAEQAMGWSARSGKIVLRIALQRLCRYYNRKGDAQMMIG
ncbi:hypothetical protein LY39_01909 [Roseinatronobacter bogoriensis subsp. barguzinensis]|nr:hypothetical protein LY39_01909 [Rhodobaca barguzinensis]TDY68936.1 hypothetical protein EV660_105193 [Rhodobaca bogoriensis DSM 18756]